MNEYSHVRRDEPRGGDEIDAEKPLRPAFSVMVVPFTSMTRVPRGVASANARRASSSTSAESGESCSVTMEKALAPWTLP